MGNQVFVSTTFVKDQQKLSYALDMLRNLNIDGVELGSNHCFEEDYSYIHEYNYRYLTHNYFPIPRNSFVINLASNEYFKGIDKKTLKPKIINIVFKEFKGDKYKIIGIYAKRARGLMVQYIIKNRIQNSQDLKSFAMEDYRFKEELSDSTTWVFTRG